VGSQRRVPTRLGIRTLPSVLADLATSDTGQQGLKCHRLSSARRIQRCRRRRQRSRHVRRDEGRLGGEGEGAREGCRVEGRPSWGGKSWSKRCSGPTPSHERGGRRPRDQQGAQRGEDGARVGQAHGAGGTRMQAKGGRGLWPRQDTGADTWGRYAEGAG